jgi:hypothetical protein
MIVAADACRVVALGAKTGKKALTFQNSQLLGAAKRSEDGSTMNPQPNQSLVTSAATKEIVFMALKPVALAVF